MIADLIEQRFGVRYHNHHIPRLWFNPMLPEAIVHEKLDAIGVTKREVCGNLEGDPECFCLAGE